MLVQDMMEVIDEDRAEENFKLYYSWIIHNFIHQMNTSRIPAFHCVGTVHGRKWPAIVYMVYAAGGDEVPIYILTHPKHTRDLRQFYHDQPPLLISTSLHGYSKMPHNIQNAVLGIPSHLEFPGGCSWVITGCEPMRHGRVHARPPHPWEEEKVTCSYSNALQKIPSTVECFDNDEFERYVKGEPCAMCRLDLDPRNSVYFRMDPDRFKAGNRLNQWNFGTLTHEDDDVTKILEIK